MPKKTSTAGRFLPTRRIAWWGPMLLALAGLLVFIELADDVWLKEGFVWDAPLMRSLHQLSQPWLDRVFFFVTWTAGWPIIALLIGTVMVLWRRRQRRIALFLLLSSAMMAGISALLKVLFARPRPSVFPPLAVEQSYSFPSGHTMMAVGFYGLLALLLLRERRWGWAALAALWVPLVAVSRVYLGVHYPSDVLASLSIGAVWLAAIWLAFETLSVSST